MKYRSRTDIVKAMLEAANGGASRTKIMYKAFLSYAQLKEYLAMMVQNELLKYEPDVEQYKTTQKGLKFLKVSESLDIFEPQDGSTK